MQVRRPIPNLKVCFDLYTMEGVRLFCSDVRDGDPSIIERLGVGLHTFDVRVPSQLLGGMTYLMNIACYRQGAEAIDYHLSCCEFTLRDTVSPWPDRPGLLSVLLPWQHRHDPSPAPPGRAPAAAV